MWLIANCYLLAAQFSKTLHRISGSSLGGKYFTLPFVRFYVNKNRPQSLDGVDFSDQFESLSFLNESKRREEYKDDWKVPLAKACRAAALGGGSCLHSSFARLPLARNDQLNHCHPDQVRAT